MTEDEKTPAPAPGAIDIRGIMDIVPHRYPFLLIDRILEVNNEGPSLVAIKNVTMNEPQFMGHYPGLPIMPGVLQIEAMAQAAVVLLLIQPQNKGKIPFFTGLDGVKFRRQIVPGDQMRIEVLVTHHRTRAAKAEGRILVDGELAVEAKLTCMLGDPQSE
jgi:3-hydroxyacyl-[acyl-carrier-protein] dehydratase